MVPPYSGWSHPGKSINIYIYRLYPSNSDGHARSRRGALKGKAVKENLSPKSKASLICMLKESSDVKKSGKTVLPKAVEALAMEQFGVSKGQVRKLWDAGKDVNLGNADEFKELLEKGGNKRKGNSGRKLCS